MPDKAQARARIAELVEKFSTGYDSYKRQDYNEAQVRIEFIDKFFGALGWNVSDSQEVSVEDRVAVQQDGVRMVKHPDYGFRVGRDTRFYVEAKKPAVNLKQDREPAFQVRRYGWSANLPISILTDFEECMVYDCRFEPKDGDPANTAILRAYRYDDYLNKWDEIWDLLSKDAVQGGALERLTEGDVRGATLVDEAFLRDMEGWRTLLAKDIHLFNRHLTPRQLNITVQSTLDRLIFLRICEDRQIEPLNQLKRIAQRADIYEELKLLFQQADNKYNSGLFHFRHDDDQKGIPDTLSLTLKIGNDALYAIINKLYYPVSPYQFDVMPADILGQVYERFLGKVIELSGGGALEVVEKPEVRKAGGVYYTPTYIVDYIVRNTVGKLVAGKTPDAVASLKILDPACGSGSFLIGAYQFLIDWYTAIYAQKADKYQKSGDLRPLGQGYVLTTRAKKAILLNNIYGVDLDQQAVEVTKLSLLLKMLEGETATTSMPKLAIERILPDLDSNIKWGNSLIGSDFYAHQQMGLFGDEELYRVKAFDWENEASGFGGIMRRGGFDAVIGNPPYIRIQTMKETAPESVPYYSKQYASAKKGNYDIYVIFVEKALQLLKLTGKMGYILPHKFFNAQYGEPLRGLVAQGKHLSQIVHFGDQQVFKGATTYTCLLFLDKQAQETFDFLRVKHLREFIVWSSSEKYPAPANEKHLTLPSPKIGEGSENEREGSVGTMPALSVDEKMNINITDSIDAVPTPNKTPLSIAKRHGEGAGGEVKDMQTTTPLVSQPLQSAGITGKEWNFSGGNSGFFDRLEKLPKLETLADIFVGLQTSADKVFIMDLVSESESTLTLHSIALKREWVFEKGLFQPIISGTDTNRYAPLPKRQYILFPYQIENSKATLIPFEEIEGKYPQTAEYLLLNKELLESREKGKMKNAKWYGYIYLKNMAIQSKVKLCIPRLVNKLYIAYDKDGARFLDNVDVCGVTLKPDYIEQSLEYLMALINSKLLRWYFPTVSAPFRGGFMSANRQFLGQLPIRTIDFTNPTDKKYHDSLVALVEKMLALHQQLPQLNGEALRITQDQIASTDKDIDKLVYELYGLSADEIKLVEET